MGSLNPIQEGLMNFALGVLLIYIVKLIDDRWELSNFDFNLPGMKKGESLSEKNDQLED